MLTNFLVKGLSIALAVVAAFSGSVAQVSAEDIPASLDAVTVNDSITTNIAAFTIPAAPVSAEEAPASLDAATVNVGIPTNMLNYKTIRNGSRGSDVKTCQHMLNGTISAGLVEDGKFGSKTVAAVKTYQKMKGLTADGICGPATWRNLAQDYNDACKGIVRKGSVGTLVKELQTKLNTVYGCKLTVDGICGTATYNAIRNYQRSRGLTVDGIAGSKTFAMLRNEYQNGKKVSSTTAKRSQMSINYAKDYWNDGKDLCAGFVARCLAAAGIIIPNRSIYRSSDKPISSVSLGAYTNPYTCAPAMLKWFQDNGYEVISNPKKSDINLGDVAFMYGSPSHVVIITGINSSGEYTYSAHNKARKAATVRYSGDARVRWLVKINYSNEGLTPMQNLK